MKHNEPQENGILSYLSSIPRKMLKMHGCENMTEFVLHELCDERCFNLNKAAYLIDNPDFNCLKGIAGVDRNDCSPQRYDIWKDSHHFSNRMKDAAFNKKVRSIARYSLKKENHDDEQIAKDVASELGFGNFGYCCWETRHGNHGLLVFEKAENHYEVSDEHLMNGASLLGFCPVF